MNELTDEAQDLERGVKVVDTEPDPIEQGRSLIVVIGINKYVHQHQLENAVQDAIGLQQTLIDKLGFSAPIPPLLDEAATRGAISSLIEDRLYRVVEENDSLIVFFAGHGQTRVRKVGNQTIETGYLIPVDATQSWSDYVEIDPFLKSLSALPARHILVILDSCHSGFALGQAVDKFRGTESYEKALNKRRSRRVITSARRDELALDGGPIPGHSLFTGTLIDGFNWGRADTDGNGLITSSELGLFIQQQVAQAAKLRSSEQTPDFGSFHLDDRGEMVISLRDQSFDKLKARALSALQSGKLTTFKELVEQVSLLKSAKPETLYLEYRLRITEGDFERAKLIIGELSNLDKLEGIIPLSRDKIWDLNNILPYWKPLLQVSDIAAELELTVLSGSDLDSLMRITKQNIGETEGYLITNKDILQVCLKNTGSVPIYVYAIEIDSVGFIDHYNLLNPEAMLNGIMPQETECSHPATVSGEGIREIRLFILPQRLDELMLHPRAAAKGFSYNLSQLLEKVEGKVRMKSIRYSLKNKL